MQVHNPNGLPTIPIKDLLPTQGELKDLTEANYSKLKANIERRGFIDPVSVWEDEKGLKHLLNGHQRQRVLMQEGWNEPIPYFNIPAKNIQEAAAIVLELTSQYGTVTQEGLDQMIATYELPEAEVYEATHFDALPVYDTTEEEPEIEEDEAPEVDESEPPKSKLGEIYQLGRHRVMCGDSTDKDAISELTEHTTPDLLLTDPPYGIAVNNDWQNKVHTDNQNYGKGEIMNDRGELDLSIMTEWPRRIVFGFPYLQDDDAEGWLVWDKEPGFKGRSLTSPVEMAYSTCWKGFRAVRLLWSGYMREDKSEEKVGHPTQKPTRLLADLLKDNTEEDDNVLDLFLGSGSTLIACEQTDRTCYGMELDPKYTDVVRKRYAKFISPDNELPENWEELTPAINTGKKQA